MTISCSDCNSCVEHLDEMVEDIQSTLKDELAAATDDAEKKKAKEEAVSKLNDVIDHLLMHIDSLESNQLDYEATRDRI